MLHRDLMRKCNQLRYTDARRPPISQCAAIDPFRRRKVLTGCGSDGWGLTGGAELLGHLELSWPVHLVWEKAVTEDSEDSEDPSALALRGEASGVAKEPSRAAGGGLSAAPSPLPAPSSSVSIRPLLRLSRSRSSSGRTFLSSDSSWDASMRWSSLQRLLKRSFRGMHFVGGGGSAELVWGGGVLRSPGSAGSLLRAPGGGRCAFECACCEVKKGIRPGGGGAGALKTSSSRSSSGWGGWGGAAVPLARW
ncbi:hypothetical protein EYF80_008161 [Liparis tanakae]|uniref:Uncharacterized protein n=1 Tax=Liparis tanakae TaxID=230148 RepID=A0A4Z2IUV5_9TELE|nr:hypothetical protein EYF80_008161 [Liparis tanakae]